MRDNTRTPGEATFSQAADELAAGSAGLDGAMAGAGVDVDVIGPGARLATAREAYGFSLGDVARQLKLSVRQVGALERDDYDAFPSRVFVRGFLRNYAKLLQLDLEHQIVKLQSSEAQIEAAAHAGSGQALPAVDAPRVHWRRWALIAALAALIAAALFRPGTDDDVGDGRPATEDIRLSAPPPAAESAAVSSGASAERPAFAQPDVAGIVSPIQPEYPSVSTETPAQPVASGAGGATLSQTPQSAPAGE